MATPEQIVSAEIAAAIGAIPGLRVWRNNTGRGVVALSPAGDVALRQLVARRLARPIAFGLPGSTDYLGLAACRCSSCGSRTGRFVGLEVKSEHGRLSEQQRRFGEMVQSLGGIWITARTAEEARERIGRELREGGE